MPELIATTPLGGYAKTFGATTLAEPQGLAIVSLACPRGGDEAFEAALSSVFGLDLPAPGASVTDGAARLVWMAPDQLFALFRRDTPDAATSIADRMTAAETGGAAYLTDQTDNWCALTIDGPEARAALERICPLDLHSAAFPEDAAARTVMEHMGALIIRTGADRFMLLSTSSSAPSFLHAIEVSLRNVT